MSVWGRLLRAIYCFALAAFSLDGLDALSGWDAFFIVAAVWFMAQMIRHALALAEEHGE